MTTSSQYDTSMRVDIARNDLNIIDSSIARLKYNDSGKIVNTSIITSPMSGGVIEKENLQDRLSDVLYRSMNFTSKQVGVDELTGKKHHEDKVYLHIIKGVRARNQHHCAGNIIYHPDSEYMLKWIDLMFWQEHGVIYDNSLEGPVKIMRSSGELDESGSICKKEGIRWSSTVNDFVIRVSLDNGDKEKHVPLNDIHKYNPDMKLTITIPEKDVYKDSPEWILNTYDKWIIFLDKLKFGDSNIERRYVKI
jgi:hypothetical protein